MVSIINMNVENDSNHSFLKLPLPLIDFLIPVLTSDWDVGQVSALMGSLHKVLPGSVYISTQFAMDSPSPHFNRPLAEFCPKAGSALPPQAASWREWLGTPCFESGDTTRKNLASSILTTIWEIPWLWACRWYR